MASKAIQLKFKDDDLRFSPELFLKEAAAQDCQKYDTGTLLLQVNQTSAGSDGGTEALRVEEQAKAVEIPEDKDDKGAEGSDGGTEALSSFTEEEAKTREEITRTFVVGDLVEVAKRPCKGKNKLYGAGRITSVGETGNTYDIRFTLGGKEKDVDARHLSVYDFGATKLLEEATRENIVENCNRKRTHVFGEKEQVEKRKKTEQNVCQDLSWVRRSYRCSGKQQVGGPRVVKLLKKLRENDPRLGILRLKNHIDTDSNKQVLLEVLEALYDNTVVQALYIQNMEDGMDDEVLEKLVEVLQHNLGIWCLNVGENFQVSRHGWEQFAEGLRKTHITHMYAGSETTVYGKLKVLMRDIIRENRSKHTLHKDVSNVDLIKQIGQMWWNPKNSKEIRSVLGSKDIRQNSAGRAPLIGRIVSIEYQRRWRLGRITKFNETRRCYLLSWLDISGAKPLAKRGAWVRLSDHKYLLSEGVVWYAHLDSGEKVKKEKLDSPITIKDVCMPVFQYIFKLPASSYFRAPFRYADYGLDDYPEIVPVPMDLKTIKRKLMKRGSYRTVDEFSSDMRMVFENYINYFEGKQVTNPRLPNPAWAKELVDSFLHEMAPVKEKYKDLRESPVETADTASAAKHAPETDRWIWEPALSFKHCNSLKRERKREVEKNQTIVMFLDRINTWYWYSNNNLVMFEDANKHEEIVREKVDASLLATATAEHEIFRYSPGRT
mmetsp:Transcript_24133/g.39071  ORF Transcript_24133/g.39071 Transcript_24133/m.39071 type:complete len:717 (-) Transcript_24133:3772-5922(-)|eukprot:CAMPEP_0203746248 /NCGR_PEP_ID=MMETSP0098-20131031/1741_1 /ASSEMBLY_ACC=CAM_ASM_000208 /TAXON_ID=96639 /ORGANISM=" , Strain NY0313808BC1" /LENGTH=716 /DNA_ID=CAMNT_0050634267 /DNA_START=386 /DNA_END=2536 /DNA_ORIENTATION=+